MNEKVKFCDCPEKVRVGRICYINVKPVYYGIDQGLKPSYMELVSETPAVLNRMMENGEIDISPVSSAAYARNYKDWDLLPGLSISSFGRIMSVILASNLPLEELGDRNILLSDESASAAEMLKLVLSWKHIQPVYETGSLQDQYSSLHRNYDAVLVIGNPALTGEWGRRFKYVWDLGSIWRQMTGLPFVFALWAVRKSFAGKRPEIVAEIAELLQKSKQQGQLNLEHIQNETSELLGIDRDTCKIYFSRVNYDLDTIQMKGLTCFYQGLYRQDIISEPVTISFISPLRQAKPEMDLRKLLYGIRSRITNLLTDMQTQAYLSLESPHFPAPLKKVFPQLLHLLRPDRR